MSPPPPLPPLLPLSRLQTTIWHSGLLLAVLSILLATAGSLFPTLVAAQNKPGINTSKDIIIPSQDPSPILQQCNLTSLPSLLNYSYWVKNGKEISGFRNNSETSTEYRILRPGAEDSGKYVCMFTFASSPVANATIEVRAGPDITGQKQSENKNEGQDAMMYCMSEGFPYPEWVWHKKVGVLCQDLRNDSGHFFIISKENCTELHIKPLQINVDPGKYKCNATNQFSSKFETTILRVLSHLAPL